MAQNREPMTGAERTRAWRERRRAALEAAAKQAGTAPLRDEIEQTMAAQNTAHEAAKALEAARHAAIMASIRRLRIAVEAMESRLDPPVDGGVAATYPIPDDQQMPASGQEMDVDSAPDVQPQSEVEASLARSSTPFLPLLTTGLRRLADRIDQRSRRN